MMSSLLLFQIFLFQGMLQKQIELSEDAMKNMQKLMNKDEPTIALPLILPHDQGDGNHSLRQFMKLFRDKKINKFEINEIFEYMDRDQSKSRIR